MKSKKDSKEIDIKNHTYYYFNDIIKIKEFHIYILVHNISYKSSIDSKPLPIRFDKIDGFVRVYDGTRYLVLFGSEKYDYIYNKIRYLVSLKSGITDIISHDHEKINFNSYNFLLSLCYNTY